EDIGMELKVLLKDCIEEDIMNLILDSHTSGYKYCAYALYDLQQGGFVGGFADCNFERLINKSFERIVDLSVGNDEPYTLADCPISVIHTAGYQIRKLDNVEDYRKIHFADTLFLSEVVEGVGKGKVFDWEKEYTDIMNELIQSEFLITRQAEAF